MGQISTTAVSLSSGVAAVAGVSKKYRISIGGTWAAGDTITGVFTTELTALSTQFGAGDVSKLSPVFLLTMKRKMNFLAGTNWYFSEVDAPATFNSIDGNGNGFIPLASNFATADNLLALSTYQGKMAVFGRASIQIWAVASDPLQYTLEQILDNVGTVASLSVKALGELDVFFLNDTGIRSLRVRDNTLNAVTSDIGSPVDPLVRAKLLASTTAQRSAACGHIELSAGQYWLFVNDTLYVLSYYPQAKISAWATWRTTYQAADNSRITHSYGSSVYFKISLTNDATAAFYTTAAITSGNYVDIPQGKYIFVYKSSDDSLVGSGAITDGLEFRGTVSWNGTTFSFTDNQTAFTPQKFVSYNGQTFVRDANAFYVYGGADGNTYDNSICAFETSWLDADAPANDKSFRGVDVAQSGTWNHYASTDYLSGGLSKLMLGETVATFDGGKIDFASLGTHIKYRMQTNGTAARAVVSNLLFHFQMNNQK